MFTVNRHLQLYGGATLAVCIVSMIYLGVSQQRVRADSLYPGSSTEVKPGGKAVSLYSDTKAHAVGDVISIIITETATASSSAATKTSKTESSSFGPGIGPLLFNIKNFGLSGNTSSDASGATSRSDSLSARIQVTITKVLPNGNFLVEGKRKVGMNAETQ